MIQITNEDNMKLMARYPDRYFDMAIVDPPYGGDIEHIPHRRTGKSTAYSWSLRYSLNKSHEWDIAPPKEYFQELARVSKRRIVWGGNYFSGVLPPSRNFVIWRKLTISENFTMAMAEYAWTDIPGNAKVIECVPQGKDRFHPTQKPVELYKKLLRWYGKPGDKILDTHLGSGSVAIACIDMGFDLTGCEIDRGYYEKILIRVKEREAQKELFGTEEPARNRNTLFDTEVNND